MTSPDISLIDLPGFLGDEIVSPVYADGSPIPVMIDVLNRTKNVAGQRQDPNARFWSTVPRPQSSTLREVMEIDLAGSKLMNRVQFDLPHFPHRAVFQFYNDDTNQWEPVQGADGLDVALVMRESNPPVLPILVTQQSLSHPQHFGANHWQHFDLRLMPFAASRVRLVLNRLDSAGTGPTDQLGNAVDYSLGVRGFNIGYIVETRDDVPVDDPDDLIDFEPPTLGEHPPFASTVDILGSTVTYSMRERDAHQLIEGGIWKCEPQPVNYSVICLYLDVQSEGAPQIIDRLYLEPLTSGASLNIYFTTDEDYFTATWTPINRDFKLRKGFYHLLPTKARFFKFEFSNLTPEPYESTSTIIRTVKLFPDEALPTVASLSDNLGNAGLSVMASLDGTLRFRDNDRPSQQTYSTNDSGYTPTEVLHSYDPAAAARLREISPLYNFHTWHAGQAQPRFHSTSTHYYIETEIAHDQRVAYTVGLRRIEVFRLDYAAQEDTDQYLDLFFDENTIASNSGWIVEDNDLHTANSPGGPWVIQSKVFYSESPVLGIQYATTQTPAVQLLPDDDFNYGALGQIELNTHWEGVGDCLGPIPSTDHNTDIGTLVKVQREGDPVPIDAIPHYWHGLERRYHRWNQIDGDVTYGELDNPNPLPVSYGGIANRTEIQPSAGSRIYVAARVVAPSALAESLVVQIYDTLSDTVVAEAEATIPANQIVEWYAAYTQGDGGVQIGTTWDERANNIDTWGDYNSRSWLQMEQDQAPVPVSLKARLIQRGTNSGHWYVDTLSMFEESIRWEFSRDGGESFYPAAGIRNNPDGVFVFPEEPLARQANLWDFLSANYEGAPEDGFDWSFYDGTSYQEMSGIVSPIDEPVHNALVWRAVCQRTNQHVGGLSIRPWYGGSLRPGGVPARDGVQSTGAAMARDDHYQEIHADPRFRVWNKPIPQSWWFFYRQFTLNGRTAPAIAPPSTVLDESLNA